MDADRILRTPWPVDLDPATVPFKTRTATVLRRRGLFEDWSKFNELTHGDVSSWWNTGPITIDDLRSTGNGAIKRHHDEADLLQRLGTDLEIVASEPWAPHVWHDDPRFVEFVPKGAATAYDIATAGTALDRRHLWDHLDSLRAVLGAQAALIPAQAVSQYVEAVSGQHGARLAALLARTGLGGKDPVTGADAGAQLGVTQQRISQIVQQLHRRRDLACPPAGIWMPQLETADRDGWPNDFSEWGIAAVQLFFTN